jgi:hypothetical protein
VIRSRLGRLARWYQTVILGVAACRSCRFFLFRFAFAATENLDPGTIRRSQRHMPLLHKNPLGKSDFEAWIDSLQGVRQGHPIGGAAGTLSRPCILVRGYGYQTLEHHPSSLVEGNFRSIEPHVVTFHETTRKNAPHARKRRCE